jgi:hypothetical protein
LGLAVGKMEEVKDREKEKKTNDHRLKKVE